MAAFDRKAIDDILTSTQMGLWQVEIQGKEAPIFYADEVLDELLGIYEEVTPEERFRIHSSRIHPDDREIFQDYSNRLHVERTEVVYRYIHPQWGERFVRCSGIKRRDEDGHEQLIGTHQDISGTVRLEPDKVAETRLADANIQLIEKLELISAFGNVYNTAYYVDLKKCTFMELSTTIDPVHDIIGISGDLGKGFEQFCEQIVVPEYEKEMREFVNIDTFPERLRERDWISKQFEGRFHGWTEVYVIVAKRDSMGECEHVICATRNIEENKRLEIEQSEKLKKATKQAQIANKAKTDFLFNMSHDIRTPMNAIIGFTDLLEKNLDDIDKRQDYLVKIRNSSDFLLSLINNVLEMARIESGELILDEEEWDVDELLESVFAIFEEPMREKKIRFKKEIDIWHPRIVCDPVKVREIYLNILSNACKYTPEGGEISLKITEVASDRPEMGKFEIRIEDTGIGMSSDFVPKLFDEFSRESTVTDNKIEGTGLGMSIVKKLVEFMDGEIFVESEIGKGTIFYITNYHTIAQESGEHSSTENAFGTKTLEGKKILLAEDNELNAEIAITILEEVGCKVVWAENGEICVNILEAATADEFDLILMDVQMPVMNGYMATEQIRMMKDSRKKNIPIYAMTANAFAEDKKAAKDAGMNGHLAKPINVEIMLKTLAEEFERV